MLPKNQRIVRDIDIKQAIKSRHRTNSRFAHIKMQPQNGLFALLIIVPKKVFKKASKRNRVKRRVVAIFEQLRANQSLPSNIRLVIQINNPESLHSQFSLLKQDILNSTQTMYAKLLKTHR